MSTELPEKPEFEPPGDWRLVTNDDGEFFEWTPPNYPDVSLQVMPTTLEQKKETEWYLEKVVWNSENEELEEDKIEQDGSYEKIFDRAEEYMRGW